MGFSKKLVICILSIMFLPSCVNQLGNDKSSDAYPVIGEKVSEETQEEFISDFGYPVEKDNDDKVNLPETISIPNPSKDTAVVHGKLISLSQKNSPYIAPSLFLGQILSSENEDDDEVFLGSVSIEADPQAQQAQNGAFVFLEVPPGNYSLFIWTPVSAFIVEDEKTGQPIMIDVQAGEIYDLGNIFVP